MEISERQWPADQVERRPVAALVPYARNARTHSDEQVEQIAASIREWGWTIPVLIDEAGMLIAGHGRVLAARKLGIEEIPVMVARGWTDQQKRAYVIADNKLAENADWDEELLKIELEGLRSFDFDLSLTGFSDKEIALALAGGEEGLSDPDADAELPAVVLSKPGDVWLLGDHRIMCGDATDASCVEKLLAGARPHLMVTDPPYGVAYDPKWRAKAGVNNNTKKLGKVLNDDRADWREAWALFPGDVAYVWHGALHTVTVAESLTATGFELRSHIIWKKERWALSRGHYHWQHEPAWYAVRKAAHWNGDRSQATVWDIPARDDSGVGHGTQKPVQCMLRPIENNSVLGDGVYEPFSGSGTTIIAAEMSGRRCFAMELNPEYVDVAVLRWQKFTGRPALHEATGRSYDSLLAEAKG